MRDLGVVVQAEQVFDADTPAGRGFLRTSSGAAIDYGAEELPDGTFSHPVFRTAGLAGDGTWGTEEETEDEPLW